MKKANVVQNEAGETTLVEIPVTGWYYAKIDAGKYEKDIKSALKRYYSSKVDVEINIVVQK